MLVTFRGKEKTGAARIGELGIACCRFNQILTKQLMILGAGLNRARDQRVKLLTEVRVQLFLCDWQMNMEKDGSPLKEIPSTQNNGIVGSMLMQECSNHYWNSQRPSLSLSGMFSKPSQKGVS